METGAMIAAQVQELTAFLEALSPETSQHANIELVQQLEKAKRALAALQAKATHEFVQQRQAQEAAEQVPTSEQLKGIEAEVGLARQESAFIGAGLTHTATALCTVLPNTLAALASGRVSEYHARIVAEQTNHLSDAHRLEIDAAIMHRLGRASSSQLRKLLQGHAYRLDPKAAEQRAAQNARRRRVCMEPATDGMVSVSAELPTHQGLAVMDALKKRTDQRLAAAHSTPDTSGSSLDREQVMADIFVELLTGQTTASAVNAEVVVLIHDTTVLGADNIPAWVPGYGPLPAGMVKHWLTDPDMQKSLRRMYTRPQDGQIVALESTRRRFPDGLTKMLRIRDDQCATPWCNSPVEDADHRHSWSKGGTTSWANSTGLCRRCNQRKENTGWAYTGTPDNLIVTTPTGHSYSVGTRPPIADIGHRNNDPPTFENLVIDVAWAAAA